MPKKANQNTENVTLTLEYEKPKKIWRNLIIVFASLLLALILFFVFLRYQGKKYLRRFASAAQVSEESLITELSKLNQQAIEYYQLPEKTLKKQSFLILGGDQLAGRDGDPILTDTIILAKIDLETPKLKTVSLARDIYNPAYQTKINALYHYGLERNEQDPLAFPELVISDMTGLEIDQSLIINIENLEELIDMVGGVEVDVPVAFTDSLFPRHDVDVSVETDPAILYEEISFTAGIELMSGRRALQYMRSRHSGDDQGTDLARAQRQNLVLAALIEQLSNPTRLIKEPELAGKLYRFYLDHFAQDLSLDEIYQIFLSLIFNLESQGKTELNMEIDSFELTVYPEEETGLIFNPPLWQTNQDWRYQIRDNEIFKKELQAFFEN